MNRSNMEIQKAFIWKRIAAFLLDFILVSVLAVGFGLLISGITGYDNYNEKLQGGYAKYEQEFGVEFDISPDEYAALEDGGKAYEEAYSALIADEQVMKAYSMVVNLTLLMTSLGIFLSIFVVEFVIPVILKNGQTVGKKIFSLAVMQTNSVKVTPLSLFVRTVLGKYAIETMVPVLICIMIYFNDIGLVGIAVLGIILILQLILLCATYTNSLIHDILAGTVVVDMASQRIFDSIDEMVEYKKKLSAEKAARSPW